MGKSIKLNLGCGKAIRSDYINIDLEDWSKKCDLVADARDLHMFEDESVSEIFSHALLEHIPPWDTIATLAEWHRILEPGGSIQIEVPDLERIFESWFVLETITEQLAIDNIFGGNKAPNRPFAETQHHLTGFDYERLKRMMQEVGFVGIERYEHSKYYVILCLSGYKLVEQLVSKGQ